MSVESGIIGRRIVVCDWRESGEDEKEGNPRTGTVLDCHLAHSTDVDGELTSDYFVLIELDNGCLVHALVPHCWSDGLNQAFLRLLPRDDA